MHPAPAVAHRAAPHLRRAIPVAAALAIAAGALASAVTPAAAASSTPKVVIVVGPVAGSTQSYLDRARSYAAQARAYGANVTEIYTPHATWSRVVHAAQGANIFIYLGHGNGWPSPYPPFQTYTKDGLGLNPYDGSGNSAVKYYGEAYVGNHIRFASGAVVLLNHLCYASGAGEEGSPNPTLSTAVQRVDNYAAGFIRAGARAVLADAHTSLGNEIAYLFGGSRNLLYAWRSDSDGHDNVRTFASKRTRGYSVWLDPDTDSSGYYRSLVTVSTATTWGVHLPAMSTKAGVALALRSGPSVGAARVTGVADGSRVWVLGSIQTDGAGRTWAPVITSSGRKGWIATWQTSFTGTATATRDVYMRTRAYARSSRVATLRARARVAVIRSARDGSNRSWLYVRSTGGKYGWVPAWAMHP